MTDLQAPQSGVSIHRDRTDKKRKRLIYGAVGVVGAVLVAFLAYWFVFRDDSAASVDTAEAGQARDEALAEADGLEALDALDGTFHINTGIGTFDAACLTEVCNTTFVGFRIDEELATLGAKTVVGRSPGVTGTMVLDGTAIVATEIFVDMTLLITDDDRRTNAIQRQAIETTAFPDASFILSTQIELGTLPGPGEAVEIRATGELTLHGVTRTEIIALTAEIDGGVIVVFGQLGPILLADYDIDKPSAAVVLSVEDNAIMEFQLFFTR